MLKNVIAMDTETTGKGFWHGDRPHFVSWCDQEGHVNCVSANVNGKTREVSWGKPALARIRSALHFCKKLVFQSCHLDIRALESIGIDVPGIVGWENIEDTLPMFHTLDSSESHGLKELALRYLDFNDADQRQLKEATIKARVYGQQRSWWLAEAVECDYWMVPKVNPGDKLLEEYCCNDSAAPCCCGKWGCKPSTTKALCRSTSENVN